MTDATTYMTDYFEAYLTEDHERHEEENTLEEFFEQFCYANTTNDEEPTWSISKVATYVSDVFDNMGGYDDLPQMVQTAMYRDVDQDYLMNWITEAHAAWWEEHAGEEGTGNNLDDPCEQQPMPAPKEQAEDPVVLCDDCRGPIGDDPHEDAALCNPCGVRLVAEIEAH